MERLYDLNVTEYGKVVCICDELPEELIKRLKEHGFVRGNKVKILYKNKTANAGIVAVYSSKLSIDYSAMKGIMVEKVV